MSAVCDVIIFCTETNINFIKIKSYLFRSCEQQKQAGFDRASYVWMVYLLDEIIYFIIDFVYE